MKNSSLRPSPPTHPSSQQSPHSQPGGPGHNQMMPNQPFMGPRGYPGPGPGPRGPGVRMPQGMGNDFNGPPQPLMPNNMDPSRQGESTGADRAQKVAFHH